MSSVSCPRCRAIVDHADAFCPTCGVSLVDRTLPARSARARRPWHRKKRFTLPLTFLVIFAIAGTSGLWYLSAQFSSLNAASTPPSDSPAYAALQDGDGAVPVEDTADGSVTMLLMGVDARDGESIDIGVRPDSLAVVHINSTTNTCRMLSIPRDTRVNLPGYGMSKVNHALAVGGPDYQTMVVEQFLGIEVDHYGLIDFAGVVGVVDALGGVTVVNQNAFSLEGADFPAGELRLDGEQALLYARFRGDAEGDFGRQRRQQEIVRALLAEADGLNVARSLPSLLGSIDGHFRTDLSILQMVTLANQYRTNCTSTSLETDGLTGSVANDWDEMYDQELSFVHVTPDEIATKVAWMKGQ